MNRNRMIYFRDTMNRDGGMPPYDYMDDTMDAYASPVEGRGAYNTMDHYGNGRYTAAPYEAMDAYDAYVAPSGRARMASNSYRMESHQMRPIGFGRGGASMHYDMTGPMDEMASRGGQMERGYSGADGYPRMTRKLAEEWTSTMQNEDGTSGQHWSYDQTTQLLKSKGLDHDPAEFYAAMNMMHSDYCKVAKKFDVNNADFYACMADAFLSDTDGGEDKISRYYYMVSEG